MYHTIQTQNFTFDTYDLVILDDIDLAPSHKRLRRVPTSIPDTILVVTSTLFRFDTAALPGEAGNDRYSKIEL